MKLTSSNPVLAKDDVFEQYYGGRAEMAPQAAAISGTVNKTAILVLVAIVAGAGGYALSGLMPSVVWIAGIASFVLCLAFGFIMAGKPTLAPVLAPIFAVVEGAFLGGFTAIADRILAAQGLSVVGGVGVQAFIVTCAAVVSMLVMYKTGLIKPTERFKATLAVLGGAIMLAYLVSFVLSLVWKPLPLISFASAVGDTGWMGLLGLGINVFILVIASLYLVIDFDLVAKRTANGAPSHVQWYLAFALLVTLAWIYFESVKLVVRLAVLFGSRD